MRRCLVVANQTLGGEHLLELLRERVAAGACSFHVVVPATPPHRHATWTEGEAVALARRRLDDALARLRELGAEADGEVGDPNPVEAIEDVLNVDAGFDEIILSTLPPGISRWLHADVPHRVARRFSVPLTHVIVEPAPA
jgi:nucleotide-binding universal stress UspA family protein